MSRTGAPLPARLGLERQPFPAAPDVRGYVASAQLDADRLEAAHVLRNRAGFVLVSGEIGTGKTTFLRRLIADVQDEGMAISLVFNTFLQGPDLLAAVLRDFGLAPTGSPAGDIEQLNRFLIKCWQAGTVCVLVLDDAQNLEPASLELVRLLTNLETGQEKLLQIVLCGQPELCTRLASHDLRQLTSRIVKHVSLGTLPLRHVAGYVHARLDAAGASGRLRLGRLAAPLLYLLSAGNPRRLHLIMDRALYGLQPCPEAHQRIPVSLLLRAAGEAGALLGPRRPRRLAWTGVLALSLVTGAVFGLADTPATRSDPPTGAAPARLSIQALPAGCQPSANSSGPWNVPESFTRLPDTHARCLHHDGQRWQAWWPALPQSADATLLQQQLQQLGQYDGRIDGSVGPLTERALRRLQQLWQLPATGQPDPLTLHLLHSLTAAAALSSTSPENPTHGHG